MKYGMVHAEIVIHSDLTRGVLGWACSHVALTHPRPHKLQYSEAFYHSVTKTHIPKKVPFDTMVDIKQIAHRQCRPYT